MLTLHRLSRSYRILYSATLLFFTAGTAAHTLHQQLRVGILPAEIAVWYRGNESDLEAAVLLFPKSFEEVWEDVWLAVTSYTLAFLVFGGILTRSDAPAWLRMGLLLGFGVAAVAAGAAPLLVRYAGSGWAWLETATLLALPPLAAAMTALALREMWVRRAAGPRFDPARRV
ncbi:MAG: hypothetical protein ACR2F9_07785 [Longimicrobiaceae bacterium]